MGKHLHECLENLSSVPGTYSGRSEAVPPSSLLTSMTPTTHPNDDGEGGVGGW